MIDSEESSMKSDDLHDETNVTHIQDGDKWTARYFKVIWRQSRRYSGSKWQLKSRVQKYYVKK
jgi:hypothetical protein